LRYTELILQGIQIKLGLMAFFGGISLFLRQTVVDPNAHVDEGVNSIPNVVRRDLVAGCFAQAAVSNQALLVRGDATALVSENG
jgi:hypothetical protein